MKRKRTVNRIPTTITSGSMNVLKKSKSTIQSIVSALKLRN